MIPPVVDADFLADHTDAVLADVRWYLDGRDGLAAFADGHLPGARWVDLDRQLSAAGRPDTVDPSTAEPGTAEPGTAESGIATPGIAEPGIATPSVEGRHPLPEPAAFAEAMSELGIGDDTVVVAYDDAGGAIAGRIVVMLRMLGHDAALLDGGLRAWTGPIETGSGSARPEPGTFTPRPWPAERLADADTTGHDAANPEIAVLDARSKERFDGQPAPVDTRSGHVPGAVSAPAAAVLDAAGKLKSPAELRDHFAARGVTASTSPAITYCGSGVSACLNVLAMEHAGLTPARLYVASWSGWSADPERPAELTR